ncbi:MAG TPA: hypothetical protein VFD04_05855 [Actinomycetes bacterium]|nr:hypothetical protein [Actinomycetes bacterium]
MAIERLGDGRAAALEVGRFVRRPRKPLPLLQRGGRAQQRGGPLERSGLDGDRREAVQAVRDHPLVAASLRDPERLDGQLLGAGEVAELALDHAQVGGLRADRAVVAELPGELDPLGHEHARLLQVAPHLRGDPQDVQRVGASVLVVGALDRLERLLAQRPRPAQVVVAQGQPRQAAQRHRGRGPVAQLAHQVQAGFLEGARLLVRSLPEGQHPALVQRGGAQAVVGRGGRQGAVQPPAPGGDPAGEPRGIGESDG